MEKLGCIMIHILTGGGFLQRFKMSKNDCESER